METLLAIITLYFVAVFGLARFFIPYLGFGQRSLPAVLPDGMEDEIWHLRRESGGSQRRFLQLAYGYIGDRYHAGHISTLTKFFCLFQHIEEVWRRTGFVPCTLANELMRIFLIKSGFFGPREVRKRVAIHRLFIHQYIEVNSDGRWIAVDVGEKQRGLKIGEHLGF